MVPSRSAFRASLGFLLPALWASAGIADDLKPEVLLLAHFKQKVRQDIGRLTDCTCLETFERSARPAADAPYQFLDRVRLEVTRAGEKELLAWPGGERFEERDLKSFVNNGLIASGVFATQARAVFGGEQATYHYVGPEDLAGRHAVRYDFRIPPLVGAYKLGTGSDTAWVGSKGSFWFDAESLALLRLDVLADQIPPGLSISGASTRVQYAEMKTSAAEVLLPEEAEVVTQHSSGEARRDMIHFTNCRQYSADSSIRFEAPGPNAETTRPEQVAVDLPGGLKIPLELEGALDWTSAAVGDPVRAHVTKEVKWKSGVIPQGAVANGRVTGMDRRTRAGGFLVSIEIAELRWDKNRAAFHAELVETQTDAQTKAPRSKQANAGNMIGLTTGSVLSEVSAVDQSRSREKGVRIPGVCTLWLKEDQWHVAAGLKMLWRTLAP